MAPVTIEQLTQQLIHLTPDQLQQVADFIAFLEFRTQTGKDPTSVDSDPSLPSSIDSFRQGWQDAMSGNTIPIRTLFNQIDGHK